MPGYRKKYPIRKLSRLFKIFGVQFPEDMPKMERVDDIELNTHSQAELRHMPGMMPYVNTSAKTPNIDELKSYLTRVSKSSNDWVQQSDAIKVLTPEIERSAEIMVSSIMSPTDLQSGTINIVCDGTDLGEEIETKVGEELTDYFNNTVELGDLVYKYTKDALYGAGSAAILILPPKNIENLNKAVDLDLVKAGVLKSSFRPSQSLSADSSPFTVSSESTIFSSTEALISDKQKDLSNIQADIEHDLLASLESSNPFSTLKPEDIITKSKDARNKILELFRANKGYVVMSSDITSLRKGKDRFNDATDKLSKEVEKHFLLDKNAPTYVIDSELDRDINKNPAIIELPTNAVVPVIVPGSPNKHIGYFILVDQWGNPMIEGEGFNPPGFGPKKLTESATQAAFGSPNLYRFGSTITDEQRYDITNTIFGLTLKHLLESKLTDLGLDGTRLGEYDAFTSCMFRNLLIRKKCVLVFVPEPLMVYFRFDHRQDGTGKSITESMNTLLSLRTVLLMSYIMAATENSIDNKIISVNVDEKQTNIQQYLDIVRNAYIAKKMMRFDINPLTVQQDLIQKSLTILPKGVRGLPESLDVQTEHRSTNAVSPDDNLMEKLTNWLITALQVPHSALNHLSENEYSRSVATSNMFFSNNVRGKQKIVIRHSTKFIRLYAKYSPYIREKIYNILKTSEKTAKQASSEADNQPPKSNLSVETNEDTIQANIQKIIKSIRTNLPAPRIVVAKAQYEEIEKYLDTAEKICDFIYSEDMIAGEKTQELSDTLKMLRSVIRSSMVRDFIDNIGFQSSYDLPFPDDINFNNVKELIQLLSNQRKGINDWMTFVAEKAKSDDLSQQNSPQGGGNIQNNYGGGGNINEDYGLTEAPNIDEGAPYGPEENNQPEGVQAPEIGGPGEEAPEVGGPGEEAPNIGGPETGGGNRGENFDEIPPPPAF